MNFFDVVRHRRSVRKYTESAVPDTVIDQAIDAALLAPNSSNMQTWRFYWVQNSNKKKALIEACLNQSAAKTAQQLIVCAVRPKEWKESQEAILENLGPAAPAHALKYYRGLMPLLYGYRWLAPIKWLIFNLAGIFRPTPRKPWSGRDIDEVCIKSAALACENFMLAITAQGFDTCPMEGFDESRVKKILDLGCSDRIVMVISVGQRDAAGIWGEQFRLPREKVFKKI